MVKEYFLGNIKGEKGDPGIDGQDGGFNGETIGVNNLIDITQLTPRGSTSTYDYDLDNGLINYSNVLWYLSQDVILNGVKHVFRLEDFLSNPNYYEGQMSLQIYDSDSALVFSERLRAKQNIIVDLTGRDPQQYSVEMRVTNTELFSGFIEKPMLVEGDYPVLWNYQPVSIKQYNDLLERIEILEGGE